MNLHDPNRQLSPDNKPCWQRGIIPIKPLSVWPRLDGFIDLRIWLPVTDQAFASCEFSIAVTAPEIPKLLYEFDQDPETFCETYFQSNCEELRPCLRQAPSDCRASASASTSGASVNRRSKQPLLAPVDESELEY